MTSRPERRLALRREELAPLSEYGLSAVRAGTVKEFARVTPNCPSNPIWECGITIDCHTTTTYATYTSAC
jgi:hypothetical protein